MNEPQTKDQLLQALKVAVERDDIRLVASISYRLRRMQRTKEQQAYLDKQARLDKVIVEVKRSIMDAIEPLVNEGKLDEADGIWFNFDFGDKTPTLRLTKANPKSRIKGPGNMRKFEISTSELVDKYANVIDKDSGLTYRQLYEANTQNNFRQTKIRIPLLRLDTQL